MKKTFSVLLLLLAISPSLLRGQANQQPIFDIWNSGACGFTGTADFKLDNAYRVERIETWYKWQAGENGLPYSLSFQGRELRRGTLVRGSCDSYQQAWCIAVDNLNMDMGPGTYTLRVASPRVCQNAMSRGAGFIRVYRVGGAIATGTHADRSGRVTVHIWKPSSATSPFADDVPVPGARVSCEFSDAGRPERMEAATDNQGAASFTVPLNTEVIVRYAGETKSVTCTTRNPEQGASFGGVNIKIKNTVPTRAR